MDAGLLGGALSAFSTIMSPMSYGIESMYKKDLMAYQQRLNYGAMAQQQLYNRQNMALQARYAEEAWRREAEYNDPANVRARYLAAGISPQAALGAGVSGAGVAGTMATPSSTNPSSTGTSSPSFSGRNAFAALAGDVMNAMATEQNIKESKSRERVNEAAARKQNAEASDQEWKNSEEMRKLFTDERVINIQNKDLDAQYKRIQNQYYEARNIADLKKLRAEYESLIANRDATLAQKEVFKKQLSYLDAQIENLGADTDKKVAETKTENELRPLRKQELQKLINLNDSKIRQIGQEIGIRDVTKLGDFISTYRSVMRYDAKNPVQALTDAVFRTQENTIGRKYSEEDLMEAIGDALMKAISNSD